jgi:5-methylcytosine-specific restriction endonuclease McrA
MAMKSGVPGSLRRRVMAEGGYRCEKCGLVGREIRHRGGHGYPTAIDGVYLSIDHVIPRSSGGTSDRSNLRVLCVLCNTKKGTKLEHANA